MATARATPGAALIEHLRQYGLRRYPGAHLKSPWPGHLDLAVQDKTFAYLSAPSDPPSLSLKLPFSSALALEMPGARPTGYGLGKSGWVTLALDDRALLPVAQLELWLDESYRAQAPKKLLAMLDAGSGSTAARARPRQTRAGVRRKRASAGQMRTGARRRASSRGAPRPRKDPRRST